jgi:hypothetical protein
MTEKFGFDIRTHHKNLHPVHIREMSNIEFEFNRIFDFTNLKDRFLKNRQ